MLKKTLCWGRKLGAGIVPVDVKMRTGVPNHLGCIMPRHRQFSSPVINFRLAYTNIHRRESLECFIRQLGSSACRIIVGDGLRSLPSSRDVPSQPRPVISSLVSPGTFSATDSRTHLYLHEERAVLGHRVASVKMAPIADDVENDDGHMPR